MAKEHTAAERETHPWSDELQRFIDSHPTADDMLRDLDSLPESVMVELYKYLMVIEVLEDAVRDSYLERVACRATNAGKATEQIRP